MNVEPLLVSIMLGVAILPVLCVLRQVRIAHRRILFGLVALWLVFPLALVCTAIRSHDRYLDERETVSNRPVEVAAEGYVGSQTCRSCHPHNHATWYSSYHRTMTQVATPESVIGDFDDVRLENFGETFQLHRRDEKFFVDLPLRFTADGPIHRVERPVVMTTGSHHMQVYWFSVHDESRYLGLLPFIYLKELQRWIPRRAAFLEAPVSAPSNEAGRWNESCIQCHATHGQLRPATLTQGGAYDVHSVDTRAAEFGIACEACHGPGSAHVAANRNPVRRYQYYLNANSDSTIVNPSKLNHEKSSQVCGQCHSIFETRNSEALQSWKQHGYAYRPGDDLSESPMRIVIRCGMNFEPEQVGEWPDQSPRFFRDRFWSDGMVRVSGREYNGLLESPCFQRGQMSCLSCHQMHQAPSDPRDRLDWANDQLKAGMQSDQACTQCHAEFRDSDRLQDHTHHPVGSTGSRCYNCHMPYTTYGLLKAIRSHQIDWPTVSASLQTGRPNACNQCHLDQTLEWTADYLADWYGIDSPQLSDDEQSVAASVLWLLRGDAGQRALMAWSYGWESAREASGSQWMAPYLAQLLEDPYMAVRYIASRSLRRLPNYKDFPCDFLAPLEQRSEDRMRALEMWMNQSNLASRRDLARVLMDDQGRLMREEFTRLFLQRDNRLVDLAE